MRQQLRARSSCCRFPAEWEPQSAVWFAWPVRRTLWPGCFDCVRKQLAALYVLSARFQPVCVLCPAKEQPLLQSLMLAYGDISAVNMYAYQSDDVWIRDFGPLFLKEDLREEIYIVDWRFNAWGNKFSQYFKDDAATAWIADQLGIDCFAFEQVLEGGAVDSNGAGCILTTENVLLNFNRNGRCSVEEIEEQLISQLKLDSVLWLKNGLIGDDTDGHIDNLARFFSTEGILIAAANDSRDPNYDSLAQNNRRLRAFRTANGRPFNCIALPLPSPIEHRGVALSASYLNFMVLNGAVLVPSFNQRANDAKALEIIGDCFPGREIIGVDCTDLIKEGGALHCISLHQPERGS